MATAEPLVVAPRKGGQSATSYVISVATLGAVATALLVYVSSSFQLADIFSAKRVLQVALIVPIGAVASYFVVSRPSRLLDPLILFAIAKLGTEAVLRGRFSYVLDSVSAVLALIVVGCVPVKSFDIAIRVIVTASGVLALMALLQWVILIYAPDMSVYVLSPIDEGEQQGAIRHPIALLGLGLEHQFTLAGMSVGRMQSFAKEPSLNVLYFMLPASLAFMRNSASSFLWGCVTLGYCVLSLSGSVFLACGFAGFWWVLSRLTSIKVVVPYGMLLVMCGYVAGLHSTSSTLSILNAFDYLSQYGDFLSKGTSVTSRGQGAVTNTDAAMSSPFGSDTTAEVPGPWLSNSALNAGWLGVLFLVWFLVKLGRELEVFYAGAPRAGARRFGCVLFLGVLATVVVFNDYQMDNYVGLVLMAVMYRMIWLRNHDGAAATG
jgi:hypothetical protein